MATKNEESTVAVRFDVPELLHRRMKSHAALDGVQLQEKAVEYFEQGARRDEQRNAHRAPQAGTAS
jgi:hypothetical protein